LAEDGIRDRNVTGVQTCALPIYTEFKDTPVGTIPKEWDVLNFKDVFDRITTKNVNNNQNVLTISGEQGLISQLEYFNKSVSSKNLKNYIHLKKGDFAYNKSYS